jgi:tetratricopeptide (TPR) repeat protein
MIVGVDGAGISAAQLAERIRQKRAGDLIALRIATPAGAPRDVPLSIQRKPALAPVFDRTFFGNALIAKLTAASLLATTAADRDLLTFNLAVARMRFGAWRAALDLFQNVGTLPAGTGVGPGAALVFRARCHEQLGERDKALALYKEATAFENETLTDDGASVAAIAKRRLAVLSVLP